MSCQLGQLPVIVSVSLYRTNIIASPLSFCIELYNDTWSVVPTPWDDKGLWQSYDRPVYRYKEEILSLMILMSSFLSTAATDGLVCVNVKGSAFLVKKVKSF